MSDTSDHRKWIIVLFENAQWHSGEYRRYSFTGTWDEAKKEAEYWVRRRLEKDGFEAAMCVIGQDVDADKWVSRYRADEDDWERKRAKEKERREYERLRAKFGDAAQLVKEADDAGE